MKDKQMYDALHAIWLARGYDDGGDDEFKDDLEALMEKLWYKLPVADADE